MSTAFLELPRTEEDIYRQLSKFSLSFRAKVSKLRHDSEIDIDKISTHDYRIATIILEILEILNFLLSLEVLATRKAFTKCNLWEVN